MLTVSHGLVDAALGQLFVCINSAW